MAIFGMRLVCMIAAIIVGGLVSLGVGEALPRSRFNYRAFPYRTFKWERDGAVYRKLRVQKWKDKAPDMSRIVPGMVKKKAMLARDPIEMDKLIREMCVAEIVHIALIVCVSPALIAIGKGVLGVACAVLYAAGNIPFIIIQRYNRPRLVIVLDRMLERENRAKKTAD